MIKLLIIVISIATLSGCIAGSYSLRSEVKTENDGKCVLKMKFGAWGANSPGEFKEVKVVYWTDIDPKPKVQLVKQKDIDKVYAVAEVEVYVNGARTVFYYWVLRTERNVYFEQNDCKPNEFTLRK